MLAVLFVCKIFWGRWEDKLWRLGLFDKGFVGGG